MDECFWCGNPVGYEDPFCSEDCEEDYAAEQYLLFDDEVFDELELL